MHLPELKSKVSKFHVFFYLGFVCISFYAFYLRRPHFVLKPQLWAEDGMFLNHAFTMGLDSFLHAYQAYYHTYARLIAYFVELSPIKYESYTVFYFLGWVGAYIILNYFIFMKSPFSFVVKILFTLTLLFGPLANESYLLLCTSMLILAPSLCLIATGPIPKSNLFKLFDYVLFFIILLSGPYLFFMTPFLLYVFWTRWKENKHGYFRNLAILNIFAILLSIPSLINSPRLHDNLENNLFSLETLKPLTWTFSNFIIGSKSLEYESMLFYTLVPILIMVLSVWIYYKSIKEKDYFLILAIPLGMLGLMSALWACRNSPSSITPWGVGERFFFVPSLLFMWTIIYYSFEKLKYKKITFIIVLHFILLFKKDFKYYTNSTRTVDMHWKENIKLFKDKQKFNIPINPKGFLIPMDKNERKLKDFLFKAKFN